MLAGGAAISRFATLQSLGWQEGKAVELQAARRAREDLLLSLAKTRIDGAP